MVNNHPPGVDTDVSSIINLAIINKCIIPIICEKSFDGFIITTPILPGCIAEGDNISEAVCNFINTMDALIESYKAEGLPVPWKTMPLSVCNLINDKHVMFIDNQW